jgi:hypothetical protein
MEKLSYSLIYLGPKPNPTSNQLSRPALFLFHTHGPAKPAAAQPTPFHYAPRLTPPFNSCRTAQARPSGLHRMNHRRLTHGDHAEEPGQLIAA